MNTLELFDILVSEEPRKKLLSREEELFELIPDLKICKGFNQNNEWHIYDVYEHILHVVDGVPADLIVRLAALFHDVGKTISYTEDENGVGHFYGHWEESQIIFNRFANIHSIDGYISSFVSDLIYYHDINIAKMDEEQIKELCNIFGVEGIKLLYQLKRADLLAQNKKYHYILKDYEKQEEKILTKIYNKF